MNKNILIPTVVLLAGTLAPGLSFVASAQTSTPADLQAQIAALLQQVTALQAKLNTASPAPTSCAAFAHDLRKGSNGDDVKNLQAVLQKDGESVPATGFFGPLTAAAVAAFQEKHASEVLTPAGLAKGTGFVGAATRKLLNALYGCGGAPMPVPTPSSTPAPMPIPAPIPIPVVPVPLQSSTPATTTGTPTPSVPQGVHGSASNGTMHIKQANDQLGDIVIPVSAGGPIALNKITITFSGNAVTPALIDSAKLKDQNNVDVTAGGATETTSTNSATWNFGTGPNGFTISGGTAYHFSLSVNSALGTAGQAGVAQSLSATIQNQNDLLFTDGLDAQAAQNIGLSASAVPIAINAVSYPVGQ